MRFEFTSKMMPQEEGGPGGGNPKEQEPAAPQSGEKKDKRPVIERADLYKICGNLTIIQQWLLNELRPAWQSYHILKDDEKEKNRFAIILERSFKLPGNNKDWLITQIAKINRFGPEEKQAIKDLFYFKKLEHKGQFIKNFDISFYLEAVSRALTVADNQIRIFRKQKKKKKLEQQQAQDKQTNLPFKDSIDPEEFIE